MSENFVDKEIDSLKKADLVTLAKEQQTKLAGMSKLEAEMEEMRNMLAQMMQAQRAQQVPQFVSAPVYAPAATQRVKIISHQRSASLSDGYNAYKFQFSGDSITLGEADLGKLLAHKNNRIYFRLGLFSFEDAKWYEYYGLPVTNGLSDEYITSILTMPEAHMQQKLVEVTNYGKNEAVTHHVLYRIAFLLKNNLVPNFSMAKVPLIEDVMFSTLKPKQDRVKMTLSAAIGQLDFLA